MRLGEIMTPTVHTVPIHLEVKDALQQMKLDRIHHLVVARGRHILGVISSRDLAGSPRDQSVGEVMRGDVVVASPDTTVRQAANLLRGYGIGCLPIVEDGGRLVGIVTVSDLLTLVGRGADRPVPRAKRWTLRHRGPRRRRQAQLAKS